MGFACPRRHIRHVNAKSGKKRTWRAHITARCSRKSADDVWNVIRDFNNYAVWIDGAGESEIEDGKSGDAVGAVRNVLYQGKRIRQTLLALSDVERSQTYAFCGEAPMPVRGLSRDAADRSGDRRRSRLRRMVGDVRLHAGTP